MTAPISAKPPPEQIIPFVGPDLSPVVAHNATEVAEAVAGNWLKIAECKDINGNKCFGYLGAGMVTAGAALGDQGTVSDATYASHPVPSWNGHTDLVTAAQMYGFTGENPPTTKTGGWGCDSGKVAPWRATPTSQIQLVPTCFPDTADPGIPGYGGAFEATPVQPNVPTLMQDLTAHGITWKFYGAKAPADNGYKWAICASFASCLYTGETSHLAPVDQFFTDAAAGTLPAVAFLLPGPTSHFTRSTSQHNGSSIAVGEAFTSQAVNALFAGPAGSDAVFERMYDDCGCFYDHVTPPSFGGVQAGIRVPAEFIGPYVKIGWTDSTPATFTSTMALIEWLTGIPPIGGGGLPDGSAYNYAGVFNFAKPHAVKPVRPPAVPAGRDSIDPADPT